MSPKRSLIAVLLTLSIAALSPVATPASEWVGDVEVSAQPLPSPSGRSGREELNHGYIEYRVRLKNSSTQDQIVHLQYPASHVYRYDEGVVVSRRVEVAGGQEALVSLFHPPSEINDGRMEVRVEGVRESQTVSVGGYSRSWRGHGYSGLPAVLLSRAVPQDFGEPDSHKTEEPQIEIPVLPGSPAAPGGPPIAPSTPGPPPEQFAFLRSELPASQWSPNWLGYSCYDAIVISGRDAEQMTPEARLALRRYLECGGSLLIHARAVPAAFSQDARSDREGGYYVGLGHVVASGAEGEVGWAAAYQRLVGMRLYATQTEQKPTKVHDLLVAETSVPIRGMFVLVLLFAVGIGPANLWLLSRYKRRIWLWWNVPAISLLTCLAVFGYAIFSDGWTARGKTASVTLLDQRTHRATTFGYVSYYCPLTPAGPRFSTETDVALLEDQMIHSYSPRARASQGLRLVDWTSDQHLTSGWVKARAPAYFQFRKNEDRRERLTFETKAEGGPSVVNALGADIERLYWADASGRVFEGRDIPAGAEATLAASQSRIPVDRDYPPLRQFAKSVWLAQFVNWKSSKDPSDNLVPGSYIAYLKKSPFVESPLEHAHSEDSVAIVYGICKGQDDGR